ncbi:MAG: E3 binding domain-containing protein [Exiguobacterium profundum]|nr:MAG: E3 binding domain-containing protein [Exiguobacterium profundum]
MNAVAGLQGQSRHAASPYARRLARERELDLATVIGSGPHGRIVAADILSWQPKADRPAEPLVPRRTRRPRCSAFRPRSTWPPSAGLRPMLPGSALTSRSRTPRPGPPLPPWGPTLRAAWPSRPRAGRSGSPQRPACRSAPSASCGWRPWPPGQTCRGNRPRPRFWCFTRRASRLRRCRCCRHAC